MLKGLCAAIALAAIASSAIAQTVDNDRIIKYYRKKMNVPPTAQVAVTGVKDSVIKGAKEGTLAVGNPPQVQNVTFIASTDGRYVVFGAVEDVTIDPSKAVMAKIKTDGVPFKGPKDAKVVIVEYSDFQCPFCAKGYNTIEPLLKQYDGKVKFIFKQYPLPFHNWAEPAAMAVECAKQQKPDAYWKLYDWYFQNQAQINQQNVKEKTWEQLATMGIDKAKWDDCYDNKKTQAEVKAQMAEGQAIGVTGTPAFFINGRMISGAQPFDKFKEIIDQELATPKS